MKAYAKVVLDPRKEKSNATFPLKLRITFNRKRRYFGIDMDLSESDWLKLESGKTRGNELKTIQLKINAIEEKALTIIDSLPEFSFALFEKKFFVRHGDRHNLYFLFQEYIDKLKAEDRAGTASSYTCALNSLKKFRKKLFLADLSLDFLQDYEKWMREKEHNSATTLGIYLRSLRTIVNIAKSEQLISESGYPFGKGKYLIPTGRNIKKALTLKDIQKIFTYEPKPKSRAEKAKDFWIFSYLCNGMNAKDYCRLKYKNMVGEEIIYTRAKTERSRKTDVSSIVVVLTKEVKAIIEKRGIKPVKADSYIFPVLHEGISAEEELRKVRQFTKTINKGLRKIASDIGLDIPISTYSSRHSFATVLKRSGASVELISESLGHSDIATTRNYLDSFEYETRKKAMTALTDFEKLTQQ